jgi:hypothetical protein
MTFTRGVNANPCDKRRSWEQPIEQTFATAAVSNGDGSQHNNVLPKASFINNPELLQQIHRCFSKRNSSKGKIETCLKVTENASSSMNRNDVVSGNKNDEEEDEDIFASLEEYNADNHDEVTDNRAGNVPTTDNPKATTRSMESIFGDKNTTLKPEMTHRSERVGVQSNVELSTSHSLRGLSSVEYDDDGIGLDFDGHICDDDDDNDDDDGTGAHKDEKISNKKRKKRKVKR